MRALRLGWPFVALGAATVTFAGCLSRGPRAYPLYPDPGHPRSDAEVGVLNGPMATIDGRDVADEGQTFALLPGCHSFRLLPTTRKVAQSGGTLAQSASSYLTTLPQQVFSLDVQPGQSYSFDTLPVQPPHSWGFGSVVYNRSATYDVIWGISSHRTDGSATVARACDGSPFPVLPKTP